MDISYRLDTKKFKTEVYDIVASIPRGKVLTYGLVARLAGYPNHSRLVGKILGGASEAHGVPCYRVVNSQGRTAPCWDKQQELLEAEGVTFKTNNRVDLKTSLWNIMDNGNIQE